jgi:diguanylate cyclase
LDRAEMIVGNTLSDMTEMVTNVRSSNEDFSGSMSTINSTISEAVGEENLKDLIVRIMGETQKMVAENQALEQKLEKSSMTMQELKQEMEAVREEAYTDSLTRIPNRKMFDTEVVRIIAESRENGKPLCIVFMDIDHFKSFNDTYGHQVGDQVLRLVARSLKEGLKGRDLAFRYGGEEFVVLLPETDIEGAEKVGNILREAIKSKEIKNRSTGETFSRVTISAGVALLHENESVKDWTERADKALYKAKRTGRDKVLVSEDEETALIHDM